MTRTILVPIDFSKITVGGLKFAIKLGKQIGNVEITLLHLVKSKKEVEAAEKKLQKVADGYTADFPNIKVKSAEGGIEDIGRMAEIMDASLICMGTHGLKGIQYLLGSRAIKVISGTTIPFIVTQAEEPSKEDIEEIVVPIDFQAEEKRVLSVSARLAQALKAKLFVFGAGHDDELISKKVDLNLSFTHRFLSENKVPFEIKKSNPSKDFQNEILDHSTAVEADLIAIVNHHEDGVSNLLGGNFDQNIITNKLQLPVLIFTGKSLDDKRDIFGMFR